MKVNESMKELLGREFLHEKERRALCSLISAERAAVETYDLALHKVKDKGLIPVLENCRNSHAVRIAMLEVRLAKLGDSAPNSSGWWGAVAGVLENAATLLGDHAAMTVLAAGEEFELEQTEHQMKNLDSETYDMVAAEFIPAQKNTLKVVSILCSWLNPENKEPLGQHSTPANAEQIVPFSKEYLRQRKLRREVYNPLYFG